MSTVLQPKSNVLYRNAGHFVNIDLISILPQSTHFVDPSVQEKDKCLVVVGLENLKTMVMNNGQGFNKLFLQTLLYSPRGRNMVLTPGSQSDP